MSCSEKLNIWPNLYVLTDVYPANVQSDKPPVGERSISNVNLIPVVAAKRRSNNDALTN